MRTLCTPCACDRDDLPATKISGAYNEEQLLVAMETLYTHPQMLKYVIISLVSRVWEMPETVQQPNRTLWGFMKYISESRSYTSSVLTSIATVAHIITTDIGGSTKFLEEDLPLRRFVITTLINTLELTTMANVDVDTAIDDCLSALCCFKHPDDFVGHYETGVEMVQSRLIRNQICTSSPL